MVLILVYIPISGKLRAIANWPRPKESIVTLDQLNLRQSARVIGIKGSNHVLHSHCSQLGIAPGAPIEILHKAQGRGPLQAKVQGALYAIRQEDAAAIEVAI